MALLCCNSRYSPHLTRCNLYKCNRLNTNDLESNSRKLLFLLKLRPPLHYFPVLKEAKDMTLMLNELVTQKKIKIAILVLATFAAMC